MIIKLILIFGILTGTIIGHGQIPVIEKPKAVTFQNYTNFGTNPTGNQNFVPNYNQSNGLTRTQQNNQAIMQEVEFHQQQKRKQQIIKNNSANKGTVIRYELPSYEKYPETEHYRNAFSEIEKMLSGEKTLDLKRAVFLTENAFFGNRLKYQNFDNVIKQIAELCKMKITQENGYLNNELTKRIMIFRFMTDTLSYRNSQTEQNIYTYPMLYDFEDYRGKKDFSKMFVTKLLKTNKGQCHSMPLLYLIIAQELGTKAYLSHSPDHTFIKIQDNDAQWYNLELTSGMIISDAALIEHGYIKAQALSNKIYLDTIGTKKVIAQCMIDLAHGYKKKYGYDEFVIKCIDKALKYFPNDVFAMQLKADYYTMNFAYIAQQYGKPPLSVLCKDKKALNVLNKRNDVYTAIDESGYEPLPEEKYEQWLKSINTEKNKKIHQQKLIRLNDAIKY